MIVSRDDSAGSLQRATPHKATSSGRASIGARAKLTVLIIGVSEHVAGLGRPARPQHSAARLVSPLATGSFLVEASPDPVHEALNTGAFDVVIPHPMM
jgi:hypothetical protein